MSAIKLAVIAMELSLVVQSFSCMEILAFTIKFDTDL